jgi:hypothetical protein
MKYSAVGVMVRLAGRHRKRQSCFQTEGGLRSSCAAGRSPELKVKECRQALVKLETLEIVDCSWPKA